MNRIEFVEAADHENVDRRAYSLDGGLIDNALTLDTRSGGGWEVYFAERGTRWGVVEFADESDALEFMLQRLTADASTRRRGSGL